MGGPLVWRVRLVDESFPLSQQHFSAHSHNSESKNSCTVAAETGNLLLTISLSQIPQRLCWYIAATWVLKWSEQFRPCVEMISTSFLFSVCALSQHVDQDNHTSEEWTTCKFLEILPSNLMQKHVESTELFPQCSSYLIYLISEPIIIMQNLVFYSTKFYRITFLLLFQCILNIFYSIIPNIAENSNLHFKMSGCVLMAALLYLLPGRGAKVKVDRGRETHNQWSSRYCKSKKEQFYWNKWFSASCARETCAPHWDRESWGNRNSDERLSSLHWSHSMFLSLWFL